MTPKQAHAERMLRHLEKQAASVWTARTASEKARARRLISSGKARIICRQHETYIGRRGIVSYEAWEIASP
jgi:hypothetical protein